jgi:hypothetical protein
MYGVQSVPHKIVKMAVSHTFFVEIVLRDRPQIDFFGARHVAVHAPERILDGMRKSVHEGDSKLGWRSQAYCTTSSLACRPAGEEFVEACSEPEGD